ncbi:MAG: DUF167 domain-containing protein [Phycisphaerales bacterium]|nr:DUF167 domain-containing protein [Phycisphaerales bacterium]
MNLRLIQEGDDVLLAIKVVPGSSRDVVAGQLADRLKVRVAAQPESGRANRSVQRLLGRFFSMPGRVRIESGDASPLKTVRLSQVKLEDIRAVLEA